MACVLWALFQTAPVFFLVALGILFSALICFVFAESIIILVDIEYNTRDKSKDVVEPTNKDIYTSQVC